MEIKKIQVTINELTNGYVDYTNTDIEKGVYAYDGKLNVRPAFQRSFVYGKDQENAVINTALKGYPLNIMYWVDNGDGTYNCLDGQQRTISLCRFVKGFTSFESSWLPYKKEHYKFSFLKENNPELIKKFLDYPIDIYICSGPKDELLEWFKTINIAGERLYPQELRNINYTGKWLTSAKGYFSRANASSTAKTPAENIGSNYTKVNSNRQEGLEQVISWYVNSDKEKDICNYMETHMYDENADELYQYWQDVIEWVKTIFCGKYDSGMKSVQWGWLYNKYKNGINNKPLDPDWISNKFTELLEYKASKELDVSVATICKYCISQEENLLKHRAFNSTQRNAMYNKQKGICPDCNKHFMESEMHAHHIIPWYKGGITELSNGVMLCKECHIQRHL